MPATDYLTISVPEQSVFTYTGMLVQQDGKTPIIAGALTGITLTLTDVKTGVIINGQNQANCLNTNGVIVDVTGTTGIMAWTPSPLDNEIIEANPNALDGGKETHQAIFQWTWVNVDGRHLKSQRKVFVQVEKYAPTETPIQSGVSGSAVTINLGQPNINVWVTTDALGNNRVSGTLVTDFRGLVTFLLDDQATYYLWTSGDGFTPVLGQVFVAQADTVL